MTTNIRRLGLLALAVAAVTAAVLLARPAGERPSASSHSARTPATTPAGPDVPPLPPMAVAPIEARTTAAKPSADPPFDQRNLYADFQAAVGSSDRRTVEAGIAAWRKCAGQVWLGTSDIEDWVAMVMPANLSRDEWDRRARYARASAARCAGFARQGDLYEQSEALRRRAIELGSVSETLLRAIVDYARASAPASSLVAVSCDQVKQYVADPSEGIRRITPALGNAARARPSHFLNGASDQARTIGINLALCDLDPQGCGIHSERVLGACIQSGKCDYLNEVDYWKDETSPDIWNGAQGIRENLVAAVRSGDCQSLF